MVEANNHPINGVPELSGYLDSDYVSVADLPEVPYFSADCDSERILKQLSFGGIRAASRRVSKPVIDSIRPQPVTTWDDLAFDIERMNIEADGYVGDRARRVIRMGGTFTKTAQRLDPEEAVALAVGTMGPDATLSPLGGHGALQARRMFELMTGNQAMHRVVFDTIRNKFGNTQATVNAYRNFAEMVDNFSTWEVQAGVVCGDKHDDGEIALIKDVPLEDKVDPNYVIKEATAAVALAYDIHSPPTNDNRAVMLVNSRGLSGHNEVANWSRFRSEIGHYLHIDEIRRAIWGIEHKPKSKAGATFSPAVERMEYVLSGIRAYDAVKHNFNGVADDPETAAKLLRLAVSTQYNSLVKLLGKSRKYLTIYNFLRQNAVSIDALLTGIETEDFGMDPFRAYRVNEHRPQHYSRDQARQKFRNTVDQWRSWCAKQNRANKHNIVADIWETYFGTENPVTARPDDVSFLQYTAQIALKAPVSLPKRTPVKVQKPLRDAWGHSAIYGSQPIEVALAA